MRLDLWVCAFAAALYSAAICSPAMGTENYPVKPIRLIVPFPPGGLSDGLARILAQDLAQDWGQQVIVDNRPGAGTTLAAEIVAKAPTDGYTLFYQDITTHGINAGLYRKLPYKSLEDFAPVAMVSISPLVLCVHPSLPAKSVRELVALARSKPGQINYGSSGNGTILHLSGELFKKLAAVNMVHVPYRGSAPAVTALLQGEVSVVFATTTTVTPFIANNKVRALAVTTAQRSPLLPDLPPIADTVPGYDITLYQGILAPAGTPSKIVNDLNNKLNQIMSRPEVKAQWTRFGAEVMLVTPQQMADRFRGAIAQFSRLAVDSGAQID